MLFSVLVVGGYSILFYSMIRAFWGVVFLGGLLLLFGFGFFWVGLGFSGLVVFVCLLFFCLFWVWFFFFCLVVFCRVEFWGFSLSFEAG